MLVCTRYLVKLRSGPTGGVVAVRVPLQQLQQYNQIRKYAGVTAVDAAMPSREMDNHSLAHVKKGYAYFEEDHIHVRSLVPSVP